MELGSIDLTSMSPRENSVFGDPNVTLTYDLVKAEDYGLRSKTLQSKSVGIPQIDFSQYSRKCVIDFIRLEIAPSDTKLGFKRIRRHLETAIGDSVRVKKLEQDDKTDRRFLITVHEYKPKKHKILSALFNNEMPLLIPAKIVCLEFAIDFYPKTPTIEALALMLGVLTRSFFPPTDHLDSDIDRLRIYRPKEFNPKTGEGKTVHLQYTDDELCKQKHDPRNLPKIQFRTTLYLGKRKHPFAAWRIMHKDRDKQNLPAGTHISLPLEKQRTRVEVTLGEKGLKDIGLTELDHLNGFKFSRALRKFFVFKVPVFRSKNEAGGFEPIHKLETDRFLQHGVYRSSIVANERQVRFRNNMGHDLKGKKAVFKARRFKELMGVISEVLRSADKSYKNL